jgi:hypothetical protein
MNQQIASTLTPQQRALLQGVAMPDVPARPLPPIRLVQSNSPDLLDSPDSELFLPGAVAGGFIVPSREGRAFLPSPPGIRFGIFGWSTTWYVYEARPDGSNQRIGAHPEKPRDAVWRDDAFGKRACLEPSASRLTHILRRRDSFGIRLAGSSRGPGQWRGKWRRAFGARPFEGSL